MKRILFFLILISQVVFGGQLQKSTIEQTITVLLEKYGTDYKFRIESGVNQAADLWRDKDGTDKDFTEFCLNNFITDQDVLDKTFARFEKHLETVYGHNHVINMELSEPVVLEMGPVLPLDYLFAEYDPFAHIQDDLYSNKIAFVALLNFQYYSLTEKMRLGPDWSRAQWAKARLADSFTNRVPAEVEQNLSRTYVQADDYIANYNIYMHNLVNAKGDHPFPEGLKLITHWGIRDELKSHYGEKNGLEKQNMIFQVMKHIVNQDIPEMVINSGDVDWDPVTNKVYKDGKEITAAPEPDTRYEKLLNVFQAEKMADPYYPELPTKMARQFDDNREIPEERFEAIITTALADPIARDVAKLISKRLGRKLQPFDIWYDGFKSRTNINEIELDKLIGEKYPTVQSFQQDLPNILMKLGFSKEKADFLQSKITVDPARGAGHAAGAQMRSDNAHLRTRIPETGMNYKGFNIAIHELGHNVEQVFSLNEMDHYLLYGVPNNAFTEAFAFVFQSRDMDILGKSVVDAEADKMKALDIYWATCEIAAVGLVDMRAWHWMYDHPDATPAELKNAVITIAKEVWNQYYAPVLGIRDCEILAVYSHLIVYGLYLPDYSLGHIIMFQIEEYLKDKNLGAEMERMCKQGTLTPDEWMKSAVGSPVSAVPLVEAARAAIKSIK